MKVPDFLLTASTNLIIAQRLARRLCEKCKVSVPPSNDAKKRIQAAFEIFEGYEGFDVNLLNNPMFYEPKKGGCESCGGKSYKGRIGI